MTAADWFTEEEIAAMSPAVRDEVCAFYVWHRLARRRAHVPERRRPPRLARHWTRGGIPWRTVRAAILKEETRGAA